MTECKGRLAHDFCSAAWSTPSPTPVAHALGRPELAYNKDADERSWRAMLDLFDEVF